MNLLKATEVWKIYNPAKSGPISEFSLFLVSLLVCTSEFILGHLYIYLVLEFQLFFNQLKYCITEKSSFILKNI